MTKMIRALLLLCIGLAGLYSYGQNGCTAPAACNYDPFAVIDDGSCLWTIDCAGNCGGTYVLDACGNCYDPDAFDQVQFNYSGQIVQWVVPAGVSEVTIEAFGAQGGGGGISLAGGRGARMKGTFSVNPGDILDILVGEQGQTGSIVYDPHGNENGGGGGTFVALDAGNVPLIIAGGGGGGPSTIYGVACSRDENLAHGQITESGSSINCLYNANGGANGNGGSANGSYMGGAGGGFFTNGGSGGTHCCTSFGGSAYLNGGAGGTGNCCYGTNNRGGFGGGGGGQLGGPGGGGGYSGGATAGEWSSYSSYGGGGGSYNSGVDQDNEAGFQSGNGLVIISYDLIPDCLLGCTDPGADNYNPDATNDDGSCSYDFGCMDVAACNYDPIAIFDDGSCAYIFDCNGVCGGNWWVNPCGDCVDPDNDPCLGGCTIVGAYNYNPDADYDDGSCTVMDCPQGDYQGAGVVTFTKSVGDNTDEIIPGVHITRGSCSGIYNPLFGGWNGTGPTGTEWKIGDFLSGYSYNNWRNGIHFVNGQSLRTNLQTADFQTTMRISALGYYFDVIWHAWGSSCNGAFSYTRTFLAAESGCEEVPLVAGCDDAEAVNYDANANFNDGSCIYAGCTDPNAYNYNPEATIEDGSCTVLDCQDEEGYNGPAVVEFSKANFVDPNSNADYLFSDVQLARGNTRGLYNVVAEPGGWPFGGQVYPTGTQWKRGDYNSGYAYGSWYNAARIQYGYPVSGNLSGGNQMTLYVPGHSAYFDIRWNSWSQGNQGGFSYTRTFLVAESGCVEVPLVYGCNSPNACNWDPAATYDDGSCIFGGCQDPNACNWDPGAVCDDGSCAYTLDCSGVCGGNWWINPCGACVDPDNDPCIGGCMNPEGFNYNPDAVYDDGSCTVLDCSGEQYNGARVVEFTKTNYGAEQDFISPTVSITRGSQNGLYNALLEGGYSYGLSPNGTQWHNGDVNSPNPFTDWRNAVYQSGQGPTGLDNGVNDLFTMRTNSEQWVFEIEFTNWVSGIWGGDGGGGGFTYTRTFLVEESGCVEIPLVPGCMAANACNYDPAATWDDASCIFGGCLDPAACNYNPGAPCDDGTCAYTLDCSGVCGGNWWINPCGDCADPDNDPCIGGCTNPEGFNYNPDAVYDDGSCTLLICDDADYQGAMVVDFVKNNYDDPNTVYDQVYPEIQITRGNLRGLYDRESEPAGWPYCCWAYPTGTQWKWGDFNSPNSFTDWRNAVYQSGWGPQGALFYQYPGNVMTMYVPGHGTYFEITFNNWQSNNQGGAVSYTREFLMEESGCYEVPLVEGCTDAAACNYDPAANVDDGSCILGGCLDPVACNYDPLAPCDDGTCAYVFDCAGECGGPHLLDACGNCYDPADYVGQLEFAYTGDVQTFVVPVDGDYVFEVYGGSGGDITDYQPITGGLGGYASGSLSLTAGTTLYIYVGGAGVDRLGNHPYGSCAEAAGGWNGGGNSYNYGNGSGGGGASDIRLGGQNLTDRVIVAGGGGGCGWTYAKGGDGGGLTGQDGTQLNQVGIGGRGGSQVAGGVRGNSTDCSCPNASDGTLGIGGNAGGCSAGGGAGGGGYYGGGGGGYADGGGGGSSYIGGVQNGTTTLGVNDGNGLVRILFDAAPPCEFGCTDPNADNYNPNATNDDGSCLYGLGCIDQLACNYDPNALIDDGSCVYFLDCSGVCGGNWWINPCGDCVDPLNDPCIGGCTNPDGYNYNPDAVYDDGSCTVLDCVGAQYQGEAIREFTKTNYGVEQDFISPTVAITRGSQNGLFNPIQQANYDYGQSPDGTEWHLGDVNAPYPYTDWRSAVYQSGQGPTGLDNGFNDLFTMRTIAEQWVFEIEFTNWVSGIWGGDGGGGGFTYTRRFLLEESGCVEVPLVPGCMSENACNYDPAATWDDGSCIFGGCQDPNACNWDPMAVCDDGSCAYTFDCSGVCGGNWWINPCGDCADPDNDPCIQGCTNPIAYNYNPDAVYDDGSCTVLTDCDYDGPAEVVFNKAAYADVNVFNDPISESVVLTRSNNCGARGLYNMVNEGNYITYTSPTGTEWHYGDVNNMNSFTTWRTAVYQSGFGGPYYTYQEPGNVMTMRTIAEGLVFEFRFNAWNNGCSGGSVGYTRTFMLEESGCQEVPLIAGCMDPAACNYDPLANGDDGTCYYGGCMDAAACNYDPNATCDNGSCVYFFDCAGVCGGNSILDDCGNCYDPALLVGQVEFTFTGAVQQWTVPDGLYSIHVEAWGAVGGESASCTGGPNPEFDGGLGGYASGDLDVIPGQTLYIYVGGKGGLGVDGPNEGGWNGGGNGGQWGAGGGGASDIRTTLNDLNSRVLVAGGGGGGNTGCPNHGTGGDGGGLSGDNGVGLQFYNAGLGGSQVAGGGAGYNGQSGSLGLGGSTEQYHFAGGGGGYYGGGSAYAAGGGGGSSYIGGVNNGTTLAGQNDADGLVIISFEEAPECLPGCTDPNADNYDPTANFDNGTCQYLGCMDAGACNYDPGANVDDGSCAYVFDCAGVCGGPSVLDACGTCYDPNDLTSVTFNYTGSTQTWQVPDNVTFIRIQAYGGQGGGNNGTEGGLGAYMSGEFTVTPGQQFLILAGGQGESGDGLSEYAGGGGGSFVTDYSYNPWVIAGGGGGSNGGPTNANMHGSTGNSGLDGYSPNSPTNYGVGGSGGAGASNVMGGAACGGNGGGLYGAGEEPLCAIPGTLTSGDSFDNGGAGGTAPCGSGVQGGIGGGGGGGCHGAGGGGGYSGGGGSYGIGGNGGGGGSFNAGDNQNNAGGVNEGNGRVIISFLDIPLCLAGCTNPDADNYDETATIDDGSCIIGGCMDPAADNYNPDATYDDGGCIYLGCTYPNAINFDPGANTEDGSCLFDTCDGTACGPGTYWDEDLGQCLPEPNTCPEDLTGDGLVNTADLLELLAVFGTVCP